MGKILGDAPAPAGLTLLTEFPKLPAGGVEAIWGGSTPGPMRAWSSSTCSPKYAATAHPA
jgi:hypothetical protein